MLETLLADIRYAFRWLRKSPAFTLLAVASFAIGIGFNTALFTLVDALLFRPLPVERPDRLVDIYTSSSDGDTYATSGYPDFVDWKAQNTVFSDMMAYSPSHRGPEPLRPVAAADGRGGDGQLLPGSRRHARHSAAPCCPRTTCRAPPGWWSFRIGPGPATSGPVPRPSARPCGSTAQPYTVVGVAPEGLHRDAAHALARAVDGDRAYRRRRAHGNPGRRALAHRQPRASTAAASAGSSPRAGSSPKPRSSRRPRTWRLLSEPARHHLPADQQGPQGLGDADERRPYPSRCRPHPHAHRERPHGRGGHGPSDRLRQCGEHAARPRFRPSKGDRHPARHRREPMADHAPARHREHGDGPARVARRSRPRLAAPARRHGHDPAHSHPPLRRACTWTCAFSASRCSSP